MNAFVLKAVLGLDTTEYEGKLKGALKNADSAGGKVSKFGKIATAAFGAWQEVGRKAVNAVFSAVSSNVDGAVRRLDTLNNFPKVMESLGFSAEDAKKGIDALANGIDHLPTTLDAVASQAQQFVPMTNNIDKAAQVTLALNNAMAAGGKSAEIQQNAIAQWTKAMAKGKPDFEMWQSLVQAAPAQMDQLAKSMMGATANQNDLYEAMKSGRISVSEVNDKMIELTNAADGFDIAGRHYDNFAEQAKNASAGIQMSLLNVRAAIQRNLANAMDAFDKLSERFGGISGIISSAIPAINEFGSKVTSMLSGDISFEDGMKSLIDSISSGARQFVNEGANIIGKIIDGLNKAAPNLIAAAGVALSNLIATIGKRGQEIIPKGVELVINLVGGILQALPEIAIAGMNAITRFIEGIDSGEGDLAAKAASMVGKVVVAFIKAAPRMLVAGVKLIDTLAKGIANALGRTVVTAASQAKRIPAAIKKGLGSLKTVGQNLIEGLWGGIKAKFNGVVDRVKALAKKLPEAVKKVLGISSPSKVFAEVGKWIPEGLALGIERNIGVVQNASDVMADATLSIPDGVPVGSPAGRSGSPVFYVNITVDGAENPEDFAERFVRKMKLDMRTA